VGLEFPRDLVELGGVILEFSVLMSVYGKENHAFFNQAVESVLVNQTAIPKELVIVKFGQFRKNVMVGFAFGTWVDYSAVY
jgi:hypothetical protein